MSRAGTSSSNTGTQAATPADSPSSPVNSWQSRADVLVAGWGTLAPKALKAATETIPIVFSTVGDPVGAGLVAEPLATREATRPASAASPPS